MIHLTALLAQALEVGDKPAVVVALQQAIELEHSTIPPYLYALYSLIPGPNDAIAAIIESVVVEEMLHLTLAANVLNALGGSPVIDRADFIPVYPGRLPGSVEGGLIVPLAPCSIYLVSGVFMAIEQPEEPLDFPVDADLSARQEPLTIGAFYQRIRQKIVVLGDDAFAPRPRHQVGPDEMDQAVVVVDVATACQAIDTIIDQGEGTSTSPLEVVGSGFAHYYRFGEIVNGGQLVPNPDAGPDTPPDKRYLYDPVNHPVVFDAEGVYGVPTNPRAATYRPGSVAQVANNTFNYTYTNLLKVLHRTLNGHPKLVDGSVGMMMSLRQQAMDMMSGIDTGAQCIGPSFEYQPVNPGPRTS